MNMFIIKDYNDIKKKEKSLMNIIKFENHYKIISYRNETLESQDDYPYIMYNNLLFDKSNKLISCFPPLEIDEDLFLLKYSNYTGKIVEKGLYISLYWDKNISICGSWNFHIKNNFGGQTNELEISNIANEFKKFHKKCPSFMQSLNPNYVYHVCLGDDQKVYIYKIYSIVEKKGIYEITEVNECKQSIIKPNLVEFPREFNTEECKQKLTDFSYLIEGPSISEIKIENIDGNNYNIINSTSKYKKIVNSIFPEKFYLYLYLNSFKKLDWETRKDKLSKYIFIELNNFSSLFFKTISFLYKSVYINKSLKSNKLNTFYKYILNKLHIQFIHNKKNKIMSESIVKKFFYQYSIEEQLYFMCSILK